MKKKTKKVEIQFEGTEFPNLTVTKVIEVDIPKGAIYFEQMPDGNWRLSYSKTTIPDISQLQALKIIRIKEDD